MERKHFIVASDCSVKEKPVSTVRLPEINNQINTDVQSGLLYLHETTGAAIRTSEIGPNGFLAAHRASGVVCIQILKGSGVTGLVDEAGNTRCEVHLNEGDLVTFEEDMPLHYYKAEDAGMTYIAVSFP